MLRSHSNNFGIHYLYEVSGYSKHDVLFHRILCILHFIYWCPAQQFLSIMASLSYPLSSMTLSSTIPVYEEHYHYWILYCMLFSYFYQSWSISVFFHAALLYWWGTKWWLTWCESPWHLRLLQCHLIILLHIQVFDSSPSSNFSVDNLLFFGGSSVHPHHLICLSLFICRGCSNIYATLFLFLLWSTL